MFKQMKKILVIGSHFDDIEIGAGGVLALQKIKGGEVKIVVVADGGYNTLGGKTIRTKGLAYKEGLKAIQYLGFSKNDLVCLNFKETAISHSNKLIRQIEQIIEEFNPDIIITHWVHDSHQDHINTALSVISAARYRHSLLMWEPIFPSGRFPTIPFAPQLYVDISKTIDQKIRSIESHKSQVKKFSQNNIRWIEGITARAKFRGFECQSEYAEVFYVYRLKT